jgi:streptogramin lyase
MFPISVACTPAPVVLANDNNVWFVCLTSTPTIGKITPSGTITTFNVGGTFGSNETEQFCARGPDGQPWCASGSDGNIFRINTKAHTATTFTPPLATGSRPDALTAGADGNVWVDTIGSSGQIVVFVINPMTVTPNKLTFSGTGLTQTLSVTEKSVAAWTAKSSNSAVATVAQGGSSASFNVTSVSVGTCTITISDAIGNSVTIRVTVM